MAIETVKQFTLKVGKLKSVRSVKNACNLLVESLRSEYKDSSTLVKLTAYRKALKHNKHALEGLKLPSDVMNELKSSAKTRLRNKLSEKRVIEQPQKIIEKAVSLLGSNSYIDKALGLLVLTGRRSIEVMKIGKLLSVRTDRAVFTGQAKTKGSATDKAYTIFTLYDSIQLSSVMNDLQIEKDFIGKHGETVEGNKLSKQVFSADLYKRCKTHFSEFIEDVKPHDLRGFYAQYCYLIHANRDKQHEQDFVSDLLGHAKDDDTTGRSYVKFTIKI
jgi:integrase